MCLDGEDRGRIDAHELHVLRLQRERAAWISKLPWRWELSHTEKPLPRGSGQGPDLAPDGDQCHDDRGDGDHQR